MADRLRLVSFDKGGRPTLIRDLNDGTINSLIRDTFKVAAPPATQVMSTSLHRYAGATSAGEYHDNGTVAAELYVNGGTQDASVQAVEALLADVRNESVERYLEWCPDGASRSVYYEVRAPGDWDSQYRWIEFSTRNTIHMQFTLKTAPLAEGDRMDVWDPYDVNTVGPGAVGDYVWSASSVAVAGGLLTVTSTLAKTFMHTARGYALSDGQVTQKINTGTNLTSWSHRVALKGTTDLQNYIYAQITQAGAMTIGKVIAGASTTLGSIASLTVPSASTSYWLRLRIEGTMAWAEWFTSEPTATAAPAGTTTGFNLATDAQANALAPGWAGGRLSPGDTLFTYDDFIVEPYTYRNKLWPRTIPVPAIPGEAPSKTTLVAAVSTAGVSPWGYFSSVPKPKPWNMVWNGAAEVDTGGWSNAGSTIANNPTSITRQTSVAGAAAAKFGIASFEVITPATTTSGPNFPIYRKFRAGVTYTASVWMWAAASVTSVKLRVGGSDGGDVQDSAASALTTTPQLFTFTFTPTVERDVIQVSPITNAATASTFRFDGLQVYEGIVAPTLPSQVEGRGAPPPWGLVEGEAFVPSLSTNWTTGRGSNGSGDLLGSLANYAQANLVSNGAQTISWLVDPAALAPDAFTRSELRVEVFARILVPGVGALAGATPTATLSAIAESGLGATRYTEEFGSTGKNLFIPTSTVYRIVRLGTLSFIVDPNNPQRQLVKLALYSGAGSVSGSPWAVDYLMMSPIKQRALGPTGRPNDANYPVFISVATESTKKVRYDLSASIARTDTQALRAGYAPDHGLGGQMIEPLPGDNEIMFDASNLVPDDFTDLTSNENFLANSATVHLSVVPRYFLARGS